MISSYLFYNAIKISIKGGWETNIILVGEDVRYEPQYKHGEHNPTNPSWQHDNHQMHELIHELPPGWHHLEFVHNYCILLSGRKENITIQPK